MFDSKKAINECTEWIREFFKRNGDGCKAVVGISGGKDSTIVAALCVKALGRERVFGVLMPCGTQADIDVSRSVVDYLGIDSVTVNIGDAVAGLTKAVPFDLSEQASINMPPRIRMATLYAVSQTVNGRVANTCNYSEDYVGYSTRYGDSVGDFSPCSTFTVTEMKEIGRCLGLPDEFIDKVPSDGLCGKTDEDNLGFTYEELDRYIRTGVINDERKKHKIDSLHQKNRFKLKLMEAFEYCQTHGSTI